MPASAASALLAGLLVAATTSMTAAAQSPRPVLRIQDPALAESSGLAVSGYDPDVVWTHVDGGDVAEVVALDEQGRTIGTVRLRGIDPYDPEALAPGRDGRGRPALFLGDLGDNRLRRTDVSVFRLTEPPRPTDREVTATWWRFTYPDGPHDAEALLVDPREGRLLVATKDVFGGGLYEAPPRLRTNGTNKLTRVGDAPPLVTDGAFLPDGRFLLRSYSTLYLYDRDRELLARAALPEQPQGESVAVDGDHVLVGSEGVGSEVYAVPVPSAGGGATPSPEQKPTTGAATLPRDDDGWPAAYRIAPVVVIVVLLVGVVAFLRRRRRGRPVPAGR
ncbi:MAG: hypothetical protein ACRDV1_08975 [Actinomycetes bacterium]